jgi:hypothetical protein
MESQLIYVELKSGYSDNGPAWIGKATFSKTGRTVYFNGQALKRSARGENHYDIETGDNYWISGIKKDASNRHWAGSGKIMIDKSVVQEYLDLKNISELAKSKYEIVELDNESYKQLIYEIENQKFDDEADS